MHDRHDPLHPVVAVPARDEEQRLPLLLSALARQTWCRGGSRPLTLVVALNNCRDHTKQAALRALGALPSLAAELIEVDFPAREAHVGSARRLAMERALARCPAAGGVILTTDADAVPDAAWVEANLAALSRGADLVGGRLRGNRQEEAQLGPGFAARSAAILRYATLCDRLASLIDPLDHDPWPRHNDHTGGSLAIRAELYRAIGGLPALPRREDLALVSRARAAGGRLVHPLEVEVEVSARLVGRAPGGMADCLKDWLRAEAEGSPVLVEDPVRVLARLKRRRAIRRLPDLPPGDAMSQASSLGLPSGLFAGATEAPTGAFLVERFAPDEPDAPASVPAEAAAALVGEIVAALEGSLRAA